MMINSNSNIFLVEVMLIKVNIKILKDYFIWLTKIAISDFKGEGWKDKFIIK